jgi:mRNA-degrading endonuclease RelE of RelBE toxin-antitoxin system
LTKYRVYLSETARRQYEELPKDVRETVRSDLFELETDPFRNRPKADIKKIKSSKKTYYRLRSGSYRAIYVIEGTDVKVAKILPRDKAYDWLD